MAATYQCVPFTNQAVVSVKNVLFFKTFGMINPFCILNTQARKAETLLQAVGQGE